MEQFEQKLNVTILQMIKELQHFKCKTHNIIRLMANLRSHSTKS